MRLAILTFLMLVTCSTAQASETAYDWIQKFEEDNFASRTIAEAEQLIAEAYMRGVADGLDFTAAGICSPDNVQYGVLNSIAKSWIRRHAEKQHLAAWKALMLAWRDAYPCTPMR
jgi:hypothetical protein